MKAKWYEVLQRDHALRNFHRRRSLWTPAVPRENSEKYRLELIQKAINWPGMNNVLGQPVDGEDFFDRERETADVLQSILDGNNLLLLAPRRVGKTSLALRVGQSLQAKAWKFVMFDAQKDQDEIGFLDSLFQDLKSAGVKVPALDRISEAVGWARRNFSGKFDAAGFAIEIPTAEGGQVSTLEHQVERLFKEIEESEMSVLIAVDELPVFLDAIESGDSGEKRLERFLNWFRALRLRYRKNVRWLLLGSVGLDAFAESRRLSATINDLQSASLGAYDEATATAFLQELGRSKGLDLSAAVCAAIQQRVGWPLPFFLQLVFHELLVRAGRPPRPATEADVQSACESLLRPEFYRHFEPWRERLAEGLDAEHYKGATALLKSICRSPEGLNREALMMDLVAAFPQRDPADLSRLLSSLLGALERDGYVGRQNDRYAFRSFLLRQYWFNREVA